jgi:hypothetical protein
MSHTAPNNIFIKCIGMQWTFRQTSVITKRGMTSSKVLGKYTTLYLC